MERHTPLIVYDTTIKLFTLHYSMLFKLNVMKIAYQMLSDLSRNNM